MNKKIRKAIGAILMVMAIITTQIPATSVKADNTDFKMDGNILVKYLGTEKSVSIPAKVKTIGPEAFADNKTIKEVTIKSGLESIEYNAFANCINLEKINVPNSTVNISSAAFNNCVKLEEVAIGSGLKKMGSGVFAGCESLEKVSFSKDNKNFLCNSGIIYNKDKTKIFQMLPGRQANVYDMPDSVIEIEEYAFWGCNNLQTLNVSENLEEFPAYSFSNCKGLQALDIPFSVSKIQMKAFEDCVNLEAVVIPMSMNFIHETAFDGCNKLQIIAEAGTVGDTFAQSRDITNVTRSEYEDIVEAIMEDAIPEEIEQAVSGNSVSGNSQTILDLNTLVDGMETPEDSNVLGKTKIIGNDAFVFIDNTLTTVVSGNNAINDQTDVELNDDGNLEDGKSSISAGSQKGISFPKYTLLNGTVIANQAYYLDENLSNFQIPEGVTTIGDFSFARSNLTAIIIPEGVTHIGYGAFYHCDNLLSVSIPTSVEEIEPSAFANTKWLKQWNSSSVTSDFLVVGDGILIAYKGKGSKIVIPEGVKQIAPEVFMNHIGILSVSLPDSLIVVGEDAFSGCNNLKIITGGINITSIKDRAFEGCAIDGIRIPAKVTEIGVKAFDLLNSGLELTKTYGVFQGKKLPTVTYESTASRYSKSDYRTLALAGVSIAVIDSSISIDECKNTVLDPNYYGFRGLVVSIVSEATNQELGTVQLKLCTLIPDEASGLVSIPNSVTIYGTEYIIADSDEDAFIYYQGDYSCFPNYLKNIEFPENLVSQKDNLLEGINFSTDSGIKNTVNLEDGAIEVRVDSSLFEDSSLISASIAGNTDKYILKIAENKEMSNQITNAYLALYSNNTEENIIAFDLSFFDATDTIKIGKLGKSKMTVSIPVPLSMNSNGIRVMCLDDNGQLEAVSSQVISIDGREFVRFKISHFSPYALYELNSSSMLAQSGTLDYSPDTGDRISPKWFLAIGLFSLSIVVFLWKDKKGTRKIKMA